MHPDIESILLDQKAIHQRVQELAEQLSNDFRGQDVLMIGVLKGSFCFHADLVRAMSIPVVVDFVACSSYGASTASSGTLRFTKDLSLDAAGKVLVIVEDIVDSGLTLQGMRELLQAKNPAQVVSAVLLDKPSRRAVDIQPDYIGFTIPDAFVVGYGLDYAEKYRELPFVGILKPEIYQ